MDTKFPANQTNRFFFTGRESHGLLTFVLLPTVFWETQKQGLSVLTRRVTLAWGRHRYHLYFGTRMDHPNLSITDAFAQWMSQWSKRSITKTALEDWLHHEPEWKSMVQWGAANLHYGKIVLGREYLAYERNRFQEVSKIPSNPTSSPPLVLDENDDEVVLNITWEEAPSSSNPPAENTTRGPSSGDV